LYCASFRFRQRFRFSQIFRHSQTAAASRYAVASHIFAASFARFSGRLAIALIAAMPPQRGRRHRRFSLIRHYAGWLPSFRHASASHAIFISRLLSVIEY
jgi:hypothetical protein